MISESSTLNARAETRPEGSRSEPLVLVVDDSNDTRQLYACLLEYAGMHVVEAEDGVAAVDRALQLLPDAILLDLTLPRLDGTQVIRILKTNPSARHIPIVALTGRPTSASETGCDALLTKPCDPEDLVRLLSAWTNPKAKGQ